MEHSIETGQSHQAPLTEETKPSILEEIQDMIELFELPDYSTEITRAAEAKLPKFEFDQDDQDLTPTSQNLIQKGVVKLTGERFYLGEWNQYGERHGKGILILKNGIKFQGYWKHNNLHGKGREIIPNGLVYDGYYLNHMLNGYGCVYFEDGRKYEGNLKDDTFHGQGTFTFPNGDYTTGEWFEGEIQSGIDMRDNGNYFYEGTFKSGLRHGKGTLVKKDNYVYEGDFYNDLMHGFGIMKFDNGAQYEGDFRYGKEDGCGKLTFATGEIYVGEFYKNSMHGFGKFIDEDEQVLQVGNLKMDNWHGLGVDFQTEYGIEPCRFDEDVKVESYIREVDEQLIDN